MGEGTGGQDKTRSYRELIVWQRAMGLVTRVDKLTNQLPREERFGLASQIQRAAISVPANIAEGQARELPKPFLSHLSIARGSLAELDTLLEVAVQLEYLREPDIAATSNSIVEVRRLIRGLSQKVKTQL